jgi:plasmid stabilization system protein ParE
VAHRVAAEARAELDAIWYTIVKESGSIAAADGAVDATTDRFYLPGQYPRASRGRDDLRRACAAIPWEYIVIYTIEGSDAVILHVFPARRDILSLINPL